MALRDVLEEECTAEEFTQRFNEKSMALKHVVRGLAAKGIKGDVPACEAMFDRIDGTLQQKVAADIKADVKTDAKHEVKIKPNTMEDILRIAAECGPGKADHADASGNPKPAGDEVHGPGHAGTDSKAT
jgi:hypothetical protein